MIIVYFIWVTMIWRFLTAIWQQITLCFTVSTENYLATMIVTMTYVIPLHYAAERPFCMCQLLHFCKFFV